MAYDDFKIMPNEFEKMADEFKQMQMVGILEKDEENEVQLSQKQINLIDIIIGFKILENLFFCCKDKSKNVNLLKFVDDNKTNIEHMQISLSKLGEDVSTSDVDFEVPQNDGQTVKMIQTVISSEIVNLSEFFDLVDNDEHRKIIMNSIKILSTMIKAILNILD